MFRVVFLLFFFLMVSCFSAHSKHALVMHGQAKYNKNFKQFNFLNPNAIKGGRLRLGVVGSFDSLNPFSMMGVQAQGLELLIDRLFVRSDDEPFSLYGHLVQNVEVAKNNSSIIFDLRENVTFHDGSVMTTDDVIASLNFLKEKGNPAQRFHFGKVVGIEKLSARRVKMFLKQDASSVDAELPMIISLMPIIPESVTKNSQFEEGKLSDFITSGPYNIKSFSLGRYITYARNPSYWARNLPAMQGMYNFDEVTFTYYRDANVLFEAVKSGSIDFFEEKDVKKWHLEYNFPKIQTGELVKSELVNKTPQGMKGFVFNARLPLFKDILVRQALSLCFDFHSINRLMFQNSYKRIFSYFENTDLAVQGDFSQGEKKLLKQFFNDEQLEKLKEKSLFLEELQDDSLRNNLIRAQNLLRQAGWIIQKGRLIHKNTKQPFVFEILIGAREDEKIAINFAINLKRLGILAKIHFADSAEFHSRKVNFDFDMVIFHFVGSWSPGNEQKFRWSSKSAETPGTFNYPGIKDIVVDELCDFIVNAKSRQDLSDATKSLDRVLRAGFYVIPFYFSPKLYYLHNKKLKRKDVPLVVPVNIFQWWFDV